MPLKAFLSCSFKKEDKTVVDFFIGLLEECGFEVLTAEKEDSLFILGKIYPKIDKSDIVIGVFSARHELEKGYSVPSAIIFELGYATGKDKPIYGFCEEGIDLKELGLLQFGGGNFPHFNRNNLDKKRKEFKDFITCFPVLEEREIRGTCDFLQYVKDVTVYSNGYGVIRLRCTIKTRTESFRSVPHLFAVGDSAKKDLVLPSFNVLKRGGPANRWKEKPFFAFRVIDADFTESVVSLSPRKHSKEAVDFVIQFPSMPIGTTFAYEWSWGCPNLFPVKKKDLGPGKRKKDLNYVCSTLPNIVGGYKDFIFVLRFEGIPEFSQTPVIKAFDATGELITEKSFEMQRSSLYTNYVANLTLVEIQKGRIEAQWVPQ